MSFMQLNMERGAALVSNEALFELWLTQSTYPRRKKSALRKVMSGARYLDQTFGKGNWEGRVGTAARAGTLEIASGESCALALASERDFLDAMNEQRLTSNDCKAYGFVHSRRINYGVLDWAWKTFMAWRSANVAFAT